MKPPPPPEKLMTMLARRGPHKVLRGDMGIVGLAGQVFAPETGTGLPGVAFGHAWRVDSKRYRDLLVHLASWGIVAAAPDGQAGLLPSDMALATDLRAALTVLADVQLGLGQVTVDPARLAVAGHGFGAAAAVYAASDRVIHGRPPVNVEALVALYPAPTSSDLLPTAETIDVPALVLASPAHLDSMTGNALMLSRTLTGRVILRTLPGSDNRALLERPSLKSLIGINGADRGTHKLVCAQLTGFLLHRLTGDETYAAFSDPETTMGLALALDPVTAELADADHFSQLLGVPPHRQPEQQSRGAKALAGLARRVS